MTPDDILDRVRQDTPRSVRLSIFDGAPFEADEDRLTINAAHLIDPSFRSRAIERMSAKIGEMCEIDVSPSGLLQDFNARPLRGDLHLAVPLPLMMQQFANGVPFPPGRNLTRIDMKASLSVRTGNVEDKALLGWLRDPEAAVDAALALPRDDTVLEVKSPWYASHRVADNACEMNRNAGFYSADRDVLTPWATRYFRAVGTGAVISQRRRDGWLPEILAYHQGQMPPVRRAPGRREFYTLVNEERLLFVTPLASIVDDAYRTGDIFDIWNDVVPYRYELDTVQAHVSTYPNRPHSDWLDTFERLCADVDAAISRRRPTMFFAACGCYGLPICLHVWETHGIGATYLGNNIHMYFGVVQGATENDFVQARKPQRWRRARYDDVADMARIDKGRYV
ncbi:hypothetical protein [Acuticoccus yangtzensis]|uniref:hypothetical protein n=1 Tax=Acuticoccus yangtzensis TaxID=1443441 RepID=UPI00094980AF|nr:hypothetical protein [Acuticoccus yangtzensis]